MRISVADLEEGRLYTINTLLPLTDNGYVELLTAVPCAEWRLNVEYSWTDGLFLVKVTTDTEINAHCDLCGEPCKVRCTCTVDDEYDVNSECYDYRDKSFDLEPLIEDCIVFSQPRTIRCKQDCKGLCPTCGRNLNLGSCSCSQRIITDGSSPFGVLQDLLKGGAKNGSTKR